MLRELPARERMEPDSRRGAGLMLGAWVGAIGILWLGVLPWWANRPATHAHLEWLRVQRIDPSAMYYTELEAMQPILKKLNDRQRAAVAQPEEQR